MIGTRLYKISLFFLFLIASYISPAQNASVHVTVDKNKIVLGEQFHLTLQVQLSSHSPISFFHIDSIPHFEITERKKIDTSTINGINLEQVLTLTSFDSGHWVIPAFLLDGKRSLHTDTIPIDVVFSSPFDPSLEYHDIRDVIGVQTEEKNKKSWWLYAVIPVVLLAALIYVLTRKRKNRLLKDLRRWMRIKKR